MKKTNTFIVATLVLCVAASSAFGRYAWFWTLPLIMDSTNNAPELDQPRDSFYLTKNSGAHAVAMSEYSDNSKVWVSILAEEIDGEYPPTGAIHAFEYEDIPWPSWRAWDKSDTWPFSPRDPLTEDNLAVNVQVTSNGRRKVFSWANPRIDGVEPMARSTGFDLDAQDNWTSVSQHNHTNDSMSPDTMYAAALFRGPDSAAMDSGCHVMGTWCNSGQGAYILQRQMTTSGGDDWWSQRDPVAEPEQEPNFSHPSLATDDVNGGVMYLAYEYLDENQHTIVFKRSTDNGMNWGDSVRLSNGGVEPCIVAVGQTVFLCWRTLDNDARLLYRLSTNGGLNWSPSAAEIPFEDHPLWSYDRPNVAAVPCPDADHPGFLIVARLKLAPTSPAKWTVRGMFLRFHNGSVDISQKLMPLGPVFSWDSDDEPLNPSIAALKCSEGNDPECPIAVCVMSTPPLTAYGYTNDRRNIRQSQALWTTHAVIGPPSGMNTARLLVEDADHVQYCASATWPYVAAGEIVGGWPVAGMAATGTAPALAVDSGSRAWIAYVEMDTLWLYNGDGEPELVFAGSSSAVPGQPSIVCYPNQANGVYVSCLVFSVYDTAGSSSCVMFARACTSGVILDTIESVNNLGDSLPSINIYKTDSLYAVWQHGDSVVSSLLPDYGPGTGGQPGAWASPSLVTADGYHPMSVFDGGVLNCVFSRKTDTASYAVCRASNNPSGMFSGWTSQSDPSGTTAAEKSGPVYAGVGVSAWAQKVSGKWVIKGMVRGEETTFVSDSIDVYQPHAVAESSAVSPSIDQLRVHLLYTAGVTFEVDSGVVDTGEARFLTCSLNISHAGSDATKSNNGSKLLRKSLNDSLFCVYADQDGAVMYASSATGDSWKREVMAQSRDLPAIAEDSSGRRWVVVHKNANGKHSQDAYFRDSTAWTGPQTLYTTLTDKTAGPAALAGVSDPDDPKAYAAFRIDGTTSKRIIVVKFDGTSKHADTVASGSNLGEPSLAIEPVNADTDRIHVVWEDGGKVRYSTLKDGRSTAIVGSWLAPVTLSDTTKTSAHPFIAADRDQIVAAWAEGDTADICCRKRSTDSAVTNWESRVNLSNTAGKSSDYPTIAMGDSVIVAWEERRSTTDYDIVISIDFADTLNIADNSTKSSYPHVLFQTKDSTPYVHLIFCEEPQTNYYEVQYNKCNLKQASEGQQSASSTPIPRKPSLAACRPNPFRDRTRIAYSLPSAGNVSLRVYDVTGRTVRTLQNGFQKPGAYSVNWDSRDSRGRMVPHGVYFYRLDTPGFRDVKKAVVAR
jgi:hypothetical protein